MRLGYYCPGREEELRLLEKAGVRMVGYEMFNCLFCAQYDNYIELQLQNGGKFKWKVLGHMMPFTSHDLCLLQGFLCLQIILQRLHDGRDARALALAYGCIPQKVLDMCNVAPTCRARLAMRWGKLVQLGQSLRALGETFRARGAPAHHAVAYLEHPLQPLGRDHLRALCDHVDTFVLPNMLSVFAVRNQPCEELKTAADYICDDVQVLNMEDPLSIHKYAQLQVAFEAFEANERDPLDHRVIMVIWKCHAKCERLLRSWRASEHAGQVKVPRKAPAAAVAVAAAPRLGTEAAHSPRLWNRVVAAIDARGVRTLRHTVGHAFLERHERMWKVVDKCMHLLRGVALAEPAEPATGRLHACLARENEAVGAALRKARAILGKIPV